MTKKVALITGGASGIGFETARMLAEKNWEVVVVDWCTIPKGPQNSPINIGYQAADVGYGISVNLVFYRVKEHFGRLDFLLTSAGVHLAKPAEETSEREYNNLADVNMKGTFLTTKAAVPIMEKTGGCIVTVSSDAGLIPDRDAVLYSASKAWIIQYSKGLALTLIKKSIRVNCVCPGATDMPFLRNAFDNDPQAIEECGKANPMGRLAKPEEVASVIIAMLENPYINGAVWNVDGGYSWNAAGEPPKV